MSSPRYLAAHLLLPAFLREHGGGAVVAAIERGDADFFIPVWMQAGFRFTPRLVFRSREGLRVGVLSLPRPRESTEAYFAAVVDRTTDPAGARYFLLESGGPVDAVSTMVTEWVGTSHRNFGAGPSFSGDFTADCDAFVERVLGLCA